MLIALIAKRIAGEKAALGAGLFAAYPNDGEAASGLARIAEKRRPRH